MHGYNRGGVEWLVTGVGVGVICGGTISGGTRFCTESVEL
jgi:ABC-type tungstate transport system substrate-binding protein